jgi:hypothetical protein
MVESLKYLFLFLFVMDRQELRVLLEQLGKRDLSNQGLILNVEIPNWREFQLAGGTSIDDVFGRALHEAQTAESDTCRPAASLRGDMQYTMVAGWINNDVEAYRVATVREDPFGPGTVQYAPATVDNARRALLGLARRPNIFRLATVHYKNTPKLEDLNLNVVYPFFDQLQIQSEVERVCQRLPGVLRKKGWVLYRALQTLFTEGNAVSAAIQVDAQPAISLHKDFVYAVMPCAFDPDDLMEVQMAIVHAVKTGQSFHLTCKEATIPDTVLLLACKPSHLELYSPTSKRGKMSYSLVLECMAEHWSKYDAVKDRIVN